MHAAAAFQYGISGNASCDVLDNFHYRYPWQWHGLFHCMSVVTNADSDKLFHRQFGTCWHEHGFSMHTIFLHFAVHSVSIHWKCIKFWIQIGLLSSFSTLFFVNPLKCNPQYKSSLKTFKVRQIPTKPYKNFVKCPSKSKQLKIIFHLLLKLYQQKKKFYKNRV